MYREPSIERHLLPYLGRIISVIIAPAWRGTGFQGWTGHLSFGWMPACSLWLCNTDLRPSPFSPLHRQSAAIAEHVPQVPNLRSLVAEVCAQARPERTVHGALPGSGARMEASGPCTESSFEGNKGRAGVQVAGACWVSCSSLWSSPLRCRFALPEE